MSDMTTFGRVAVDKGLISEADLAEAMRRVDQASRQGRQLDLADALVELGHLTATQVRRVREGTSFDSRSGSKIPTQDNKIPGYRIEGKLGAGAMATVFLAKQLSLDRMVAIKVLPKRLAADAEYVERFYKEGKAAAALNHPNIVGAYDVGHAGSYHYFVMEYVDGDTVYDRLAKGKTYSEKEALAIMIPIAKALEHAHERGFIHRDVKPKNMMITKKGIPKLADLGLARDMSDTQAANAEKGRAYGTPYYIAPEQIRGEVDIDFRADIYGLGATLYHMVTGRVPFEGETGAEVMSRHLKDRLIPPDHINQNLSVGIGEVIEMMMAKDRNDRYASTRDLISDLELLAAGEAPSFARRNVQNNLLSELQRAEIGDADQNGQRPESTEEIIARLRMDNEGKQQLVIMLAVGLGVSVLANIGLAYLYFAA